MIFVILLFLGCDWFPCPNESDCEGGRYGLVTDPNGCPSRSCRCAASLQDIPAQIPHYCRVSTTCTFGYVKGSLPLKVQSQGVQGNLLWGEG